MVVDAVALQAATILSPSGAGTVVTSKVVASSFHLAVNVSEADLAALAQDPTFVNSNLVRAVASALGVENSEAVTVTSVSVAVDGSGRLQVEYEIVYESAMAAAQAATILNGAANGNAMAGSMSADFASKVVS